MQFFKTFLASELNPSTKILINKFNNPSNNKTKKEQKNELPLANGVLTQVNICKNIKMKKLIRN